MEIKKPTLLVDEQKCRRNILKMVDKSTQAHALLRPHFKTHHSAKIASWYKEAGVHQCAVSSVSMAEYFAEHGWKDITIAFPYNPLESTEIDDLAQKIELNILIESIESLNHASQNLKNAVGYFIKIDVGAHRTGIDHRNHSLIQELIPSSKGKMKFKGFLSHAGHTYGAKGKENIQWIFDAAAKMLTPLREKFGGILSFGDTPSCSVIEDLSMYDELRPGNFIFYDWMQHEIGSCSMEEIAVCLACPIVAIHEERGEVVIFGGAVHLSKDHLPRQKNKYYGKAVSLTEAGWGHEIMGEVNRISQEHGVVKVSKKNMAHIKIGDLIGVIPVHSCLTADLQGYYLSTSGERIDKIIKK